MRRICFAVISTLVVFSASPIRAADPIEDSLAATFRIASKETSGTCFLVDDGKAKVADRPCVVLVTAAHFFAGAPAAECQLVLRSAQADQSFVRREHTIPIRSGGKPLWKKHPEMDIAALRIELPTDVAVSPLNLDQIADAAWVDSRKIRVGQEIFVPCYPAKLAANEAGWPVLRKGSIATYPLAPVKNNKTILIDCITFGGDSGAPVVVIRDEKPHVVGMVLGMHRQTDKASLPFEERTVHTPLGLAIVAQAAFIRETIELLDSVPR